MIFLKLFSQRQHVHYYAEAFATSFFYACTQNTHICCVDLFHVTKPKVKRGRALKGAARPTVQFSCFTARN